MTKLWLTMTLLTGGGLVASEAVLAQNTTASTFSAQAPTKATSKRTVKYELKIGADGRPTACKVFKSDASAAQDEFTCRLVMRRGRFNPATDREGRPTASTYRGKLTWVAER